MLNFQDIFLNFEFRNQISRFYKADLLLKGEAPTTIMGSPKHSILANNAFPACEFDFMPIYYSKSCKIDLERTGSKRGEYDAHFLIDAIVNA